MAIRHPLSLRRCAPRGYRGEGTPGFVIARNAFYDVAIPPVLAMTTGLTENLLTTHLYKLSNTCTSILQKGISLMLQIDRACLPFEYKPILLKRVRLLQYRADCLPHHIYKLSYLVVQKMGSFLFLSFQI